MLNNDLTPETSRLPVESCGYLRDFVVSCNNKTFVPSEIEMLVDDPKDYEELHEMALDQELCIHITEDMLTMSPDQTNGYSGTEHVSLFLLYFYLFTF